MRDPIAIIGIGCRFPGAPDVRSFWNILRDGIETVGEYSGHRFAFIDRVFGSESVSRGAIASRRGGFLSELDRFDAGFFGISPREATLLDPQQRLLLEVAWDAVEDAGILPADLSGSTTGVFVGLWNSDYEHCLYDSSRDLDFYATTGAGRYSASGRLAYLLDLRGPNLTVDTACSSSLAAIHLACASLRRGESQLALAGGVNVILRPEITLLYSGANMLSPEGRCKFGDAAADGYVRSEGAGIVLLKSLSRAIADGDPVYALIRGSALNNDGRSGGSLIFPSREGQEEMLRAALRDAGISPHEVDYIEAHGTGTPAGDPVEIEAIASVVAAERRNRPCRIGSVKTNIGHTESAAGVAGLIKVALSLDQNAIPASLHFREPNPRIRWNNDAVAIQTEKTPWPDEALSPVAGVSGFGITGTNAHVVLQRAPAFAADWEDRPGDNPDRPQLFLLSGHTPGALQASAASWRQRLIEDAVWPGSLSALAYTAGARRMHHEFRLALTAATRVDLLNQLTAWDAKKDVPGIRSGRRGSEESWKAVFVFPGQGGQWAGMGSTLLRQEPIFRDSISRCDQAIEKYTRWSVRERLSDPGDLSLWPIDVVQPVLFSVMIALAELWRSLGVEPAAVVGHSMGEAAAAAFCGALTLDDAAAVICHRSRLMRNASGRGLMAVAELGLSEAEGFVRDYAGRISIAANNSPTSTVLSGDSDAIEDALARLEAMEIFCRRIKVDVASHCAHMDPFREELAQELARIRPVQSSVPFYSTTTGIVEDGGGLDAQYWSRNLRQPVFFSSAVQALLRDGFNAFIEVNAHPVLLQAVEDGIRHAQKEAVAVPSLRRDKDERLELLDALSMLHVAGFPIDFGRLYKKNVCVRLPPYAYQRERCWMEENDFGRPHGTQEAVHPNLGTHVESSVEEDTHFWEARLGPTGECGDASALLTELTLAAVSEIFAQPMALEDLEFFPLLEDERRGQVVISRAGNGRWSLRISAKTDGGWSVRCRCVVRTAVSEDFLPTPGASGQQAPNDAGEPLAALWQLATRVVAERNGAGPWSVKTIAKLISHTNVMSAKRVVCSIPVDSAPFPETNGHFEREDGAVLLELRGIKFEPAVEQDPAKLVYELGWRPMDQLPESSRSVETWILLGDSGAMSDTLAQKLGRERCICVSDTDSLRRALESGMGKEPASVVLLPRSKGADPQDAFRESLRLVQAVQALTATTTKTLRLWIITSEAWVLAEDSPAISPVQGTLWGLGRAITTEHFELSCTSVDLPASPSEDDFEALAGLLHQDSPEDQLIIRGSQCFVARMERPVDDKHFEKLTISPDATYLVTGGTGGIGLELAEWLVSKDARSLAIVARRPPTDAVRRRFAALGAKGAMVRVLNADVADRCAMETVFQTIASEMPSLRGIFHLAGSVRNLQLRDLDEQSLDSVFRPKIAGAWNLHSLSQDLPLDFFVLFSSVASVLSQPGQAGYAAANAYLDSLARYRQSLGMPALSIQWGAWKDVGMVAKQHGVREGVRAWQEQGVFPFSPSVGLEVLQRLLQSGATNSLVLPVRWQQFARSFGGRLPRAFVDLAPRSSIETQSELPTTSIRETLLALPPGPMRRMHLENHLQQVLAGVLRADASRLSATKPIGSLGVDSLMALQFVRKLAVTTAVKLPATAVFNYPTLRLLAGETARRMKIPLDSEAPSVEAAGPKLVEQLGARLTEEEAIRALRGETQ